ncbi:MAG: signal peptide-containing protein [Phycisphaerae bacterium]|nr:signal peptide-containing protein [Phycisphaerae bacterium]
MLGKTIKLTLIVVVCSALIGSLVFGTDMISYIRCSANSVQSAVKDAIPIEFELRRAGDMLEDIIPEMHAQIRLIAQEEVEVAALKGELDKSRQMLTSEFDRIRTLKTALEADQVSYRFGAREFSRSDVKADLAARFERYKEAELVINSKERLLTTRENSLNAAMALLEKTKSQKRLLTDKVSTLEGRFRVAKAQAVGSTHLNLDSTKLTQAEKLIDQINKRLDVAERVLAHESHFVQTIPVDVIQEKDLLAQIEEHFNPVDAPSEEMAVAKNASADSL